MSLSKWLAHKDQTRAGILPGDDGYFVTADVVIDDPREPRITPTGIFDHRGMMLLRVAVPIKVPMGFHTPVQDPEPDEVETIVPEDMLAVSDCGLGVGYLTPEEVDEYDEPSIEEVIHAALEQCGGDVAAAKKLLSDNGIEVEFDVTPKTTG